jgi:hypothetical protein
MKCVKSEGKPGRVHNMSHLLEKNDKYLGSEESELNINKIIQRTVH